MSKMGISTIQSYRGAQIFEAIGLNEEFVDRYFDKTASRIGGVGLEEIARETLYHHRRAYADREVGPTLLEEGGQYQWRRDGEFHLFNPETVFRLQHATRSGRYDIFKSTRSAVDEQNERLCTLRGLFDFKFDECHAGPDRGGRAGRVDRQAVRHRRDVATARSAAEAHETLAIAMNRLGGKSNTGEGGEDPAPVHRPMPNGDSQPQRDQAGRLGPVRRDERVPGQRRRAPDQDGAGGQARRGRPAPRPQGLALDRQGPLLDAGRRPDQPAAAPRHLLDRGPGPAHPRPEELQPAGPDQRQARGRGRRRHGRRRASPRRTATSS